jgi:peptide/nickel transport system substrate-binding protein
MSKRRVRKGFLFLAVSLCFVASHLVHVSGPAAQSAKPPEKVLLVGTSDYLWGIDPMDLRSYTGHMLSAMLFDPLVRLEATSEGWKFAPGLAARWNTPDKGLTWDFDLRTDVFFHDGSKLTAETVKFGIERILTAKKGEYFAVAPYIKQVSVLSESRVRFVLNGPYAGFPVAMASSSVGIVSKAAVEKSGVDFSTKVLSGTGPFKLERWIAGDEVVFTKNPNHWNKDRIAKIDRFILKFFKDPTTLKLSLEQRQIDIAHRYLLATDREMLSKDPNFITYRAPEVFVRFLTTNLKNKYLSNALVRQAIAYAIDYETICSLRGDLRAYGMFWPKQVTPDLGAMEPQKQFKYDPAKAKQLLADAGYPNGLPEPLELIYTPVTYGAEETEFATMLKSNLDAVGIRINLKSNDSTLHIATINTGNTALALFSFTSLSADPDYSINFNFHSSSLSASTRFGLNDPKIDQLVIQGREEIDPNKRTEIYRQIQATVDGAPSTKVYISRPYNFVFTRKWVKGDLTPRLMQGFALDWTKADIDLEMKSKL